MEIVLWKYHLIQPDRQYRYEKLASLNTSGFHLVIIFGRKNDTPSIKKLTVYIGFYIDKTKSDGELARQKIT